MLVTLAAVWFGDPTTVAAAAIYGLSLIAMFVCSAIYNLVSLPAWKDVLRRVDQSAIYVKIAGSYTPFAVLTGTHAGFFLAGVWGTAVLGASLIILSPTPLKWASILLYLGLGWAGALIGGPMLAALSPAGFALIVAAGSIYTAGLSSSSGSGCRSTTPSGTSSCSRRASCSMPRCCSSSPAALRRPDRHTMPSILRA